jgi:hypothetical protein
MHNYKTFMRTIYIIACLLIVQQAFAQGLADPLTIQGIDHNVLSSAASRAMGGTTISILNDPGIMFSNPASLQSLNGIQISLGGFGQFSKSEQVQHYSPLKYYSNFSLLMEGLTGYISDPDSLHPGLNPGDTVQRPFDNIGPNWNRKKDRGFPLSAFFAMPVTLGRTKLSFSIGTVEYADLNHYYQNNNVLAPHIGTERPVPTPLPPNNPDSTVPVQWYKYFRSREGSIRGYGAAIAGSITDKISLGLSGMALSGSTDDVEQFLGRGRLVFFYNYFRLDSMYRQINETGTSDYKGFECTFSGVYRGSHVSVGFSLKPPTTITRSYTTEIEFDTTGTPSVTAVSGQDEIKLPWRGMFGFTISPIQKLTVGLEYEIRPYSSAEYTSPDGFTSKPWLSAEVLHFGVEYRPLTWLALRTGLRGQAEIFEQAGNPIAGEPVIYSVYSAGCGISYSNMQLNVTYEYFSMKYQDVWQTNVNHNSERRHCIVADLIYFLPNCL